MNTPSWLCDSSRLELTDTLKKKLARVANFLYHLHMFLLKFREIA